MSSATQIENRQQNDEIGVLIGSDAVLPETDVNVLRTEMESGLEKSFETDSHESLTSIDRISKFLDSNPLSFSSSDSGNGYFPSLSSKGSESDSLEITNDLFQAELMKFLESFGVNENEHVYDDVIENELANIDDLNDNTTTTKSDENDVDDFVKSMQMMGKSSNDAEKEQVEQPSSWFGLSKLGGVMKGVVNESVHGWQTLGHGVKRMLSGTEEQQSQVTSDNLIDLDSDDSEKPDKSSTNAVTPLGEYSSDLLNDIFECQTQESSDRLDMNADPSEQVVKGAEFWIGEPNEEKGVIDDEKDDNTLQKGYTDLKTFGTAMKGLFTESLFSGHSPLETMTVEESEMTMEDNGQSTSEKSGVKKQKIQENDVSEEIPKTLQPCDRKRTKKESIDSVINDMSDPLTSVRYLFGTGSESEQHVLREQEVADVVEYVTKISCSSKEVLLAYQAWIPIRKDTIKQLKKIERDMDESGRDTKFLDTIGIGSGLAGSAVALTGLFLAPLTGGIATGLILKGGLMAGVGGVTSAGAAIGGSLSMKEKTKQVEACIMVDKEKTEVLFEKLRSHASVINQVQVSIDNLRHGIMTMIAQGVKFGAKTRKLLLIGMDVIKHNKSSVRKVLKRLGLPSIKNVNTKMAAVNFAKAGAPTMIGVKAVRAMRVGHSLVPYLFMATAVWESIELYSTVSSLVRGDSVPEAAEVQKLIDNLETEIQDIRNELRDLGILLDADDDIAMETPSETCRDEAAGEIKVAEVNNNTSDEDSSVSMEMKYAVKEHAD